MSKKIFISQAMNGLSMEEIKATREKALITIKKSKKIPDFENAKILDNILAFSEKKPPLFFLGKSLELMSEADLVIFIGDISNSRGCLIEHQCAKAYGIDIFEYK